LTSIRIYIDKVQCIEECKEECPNYDMCFRIFNSTIKGNGHLEAKLY